MGPILCTLGDVIEVDAQNVVQDISVDMFAASAQGPPCWTWLELSAAFDKARFFSLRGPFEHSAVSDLPSVIVTYDDGKRQHRIRHNHGCGDVPGSEALTALEEAIDRIAGSARQSLPTGKLQ